MFFDGATSARRDVEVELAPDVLRIRAADGTVLAEWPYDRLEHLSAPDGMLRLGKADNPVLARLEVRDPQLAAAIDERFSAKIRELEQRPFEVARVDGLLRRYLLPGIDSIFAGSLHALERARLVAAGNLEARRF